MSLFVKNIRDAFQLPNKQYAVISAVNLLDGEQYTLQYLACEDCEKEIWIDYSPCGAPILVDQYYNPVIVQTAGRYRLEPVGQLNSAAAACVTFFEK